MTVLPPRTPKRRTEATALAEIRIAVNMIEGCRVWRNNTGKLRDEQGRVVAFGLAPGSADLIGMAKGRFLSIEVKHPSGGRMTPDQIAWMDLVREIGGIAFVAHSVGEAVESLRTEGIVT